MRVSTKLYGSVGSLASIGLLVAGAGIWYIRTLGKELTEATGKTAVKLDLVNATRARSWEMISALRGAFLFAQMKDHVELDACVHRWEGAFRRTGEQIREIRPLLVSEQGRRDLATFESGVDQFGRMSANYIRLSRARKFNEVLDLLPKVETFAIVADDSLTDLKLLERQSLKNSQKRSDSLRSQSLFVNALMSCLLVLIVIGALIEVRSACRTLASAARDLSEGAEQVANAASQVSASSQSLAQGSSEQAASLEETSASSEEISSMARQNSENSRAATNLVTESQHKFTQASLSLSQMVVAMTEIDSQSDKISKIIKVIDDIAFQTNILALNAAVEAARAGEAGMGFAVVADEVRNLAQRCAQAAKDTAVLIEESIAKSSDGKATVDHVALAIRTITGEAAKIKTLVDEVNMSSDQQTRGIEQIGKAITQMEQITQTTAANAQQSAAAAQALNGQSEALKEIVNRLGDMVGSR